MLTFVNGLRCRPFLVLGIASGAAALLLACYTVRPLPQGGVWSERVAHVLRRRAAGLGQQMRCQQMLYVVGV